MTSKQEAQAIALQMIGENPAKIFGIKNQADIFSKVQPFFYDKGGLWWLWDNESYCWKLCDEVDILNMIDETTDEDIISPGTRTIILNTLKQKGRLKIPKPIKKTWIQFKHKIYDALSGESFEASPEWFVTNPIPYELSGNPETPNMDRIFKEWVGEKYLPTLFEILAYCLIPNYPINRMFCFIGNGLNGKSCFLNLLRKFVGEQNVCTTELDLLLSSRFEVTRLYKKLVCLMGETNFNEMSRTSILKKLTGGDTIGFEYKNKTPFEDYNYAKVLLATNNLPTTTDKTIGFYRRWLIIDFPNHFSEKKDILAEIPEEEYSNLATQCFTVLKDLLDKREFTHEGTVEERIERYESKSNFLGKFIEEFTTEDTMDFITVRDFYNKFNEWCKEHRHRETSETSLGMAMKKLGIEQARKTFQWMNDGRGGQARVWLGMKWKE
jgi:putative DNA primase/helicase